MLLSKPCFVEMLKIIIAISDAEGLGRSVPSQIHIEACFAAEALLRSSLESSLSCPSDQSTHVRTG